MNQHSNTTRVPAGTEEGAGLIAHAAEPSRPPSPPIGAYNDDHLEDPYAASSDLGYRGAATTSNMSGYPSSQTRGYPPPQQHTGYPSRTTPHLKQQQRYGEAMTTDSDFPEVPAPRVNTAVMAGRDEESQIPAGGAQGRRPQPDDLQRQIGVALWGQNPHQHSDGPMI